MCDVGVSERHTCRVYTACVKRRAAVEILIHTRHGLSRATVRLRVSLVRFRLMFRLLTLVGAEIEAGELRRGDG